MGSDAGKAIQELTSSLQQALGGDLVTLMLYGSVARGTQVPGRSDHNLLLVLRQASADTLHRAAPALGAWARAGHPPPLIQSEADWRRSADVFPLELEDIREAHRVLAGSDATQGLATTREHQRHELEREARGKLIRLRAEYAVASLDGAALAELLARATGTFLVLFRGALRLKGGALPADPGELVLAAGAAAGFDPAPFGWALEARRKVPAPPLTPRDGIAAAYLAAVERFVEYVDELQG